MTMPSDCILFGATPQGLGTDCRFTACASSQPGEVPSGTVDRPGAPLVVRKGAAAADLDLTWTVSCSPEAIDQTVHEGALGDWYRHDAISCATGGASPAASLIPAGGSRYFLIAPVTAVDEGSYGLDSFGDERPVSSNTCLPTNVLTCP